MLFNCDICFNSSSLSSVTGSSSTLNEENRGRLPSYGAAYTVTSLNSVLQEQSNTNNHGSQGSSSSYENLNTTKKRRWSGVSDSDKKSTPSSVGVTLKKPTSKGTLYAIASGPQSPGPQTPTNETPLFGSTSQRDRHPRVVVDEHGKIVGGEGVSIEVQLSKNGEVDAKYTYDSDRLNQDKIPYKETTLGAVVTTTSTYTQDNEDVTEASMTETMDKIEKAFAFKAPNVVDSPRYDYGKFDRTSGVRRSARSSQTDLNQRQPSEESPYRKDSGERTIVAQEIKSDIARALSHEELQVQLILEELQQAEKDLGGVDGKVEVQTVVEMTRGNDEVIRESTPKNKEYDSRLAHRNSIIERLESQKHGGDRVEGIKIYHAKSRSSPADVTKAQNNFQDRLSRTKLSQSDLTSNSKSDQEKTTKENNDVSQRRQSRRRRSERLEQSDAPKTPDTRTVKPIVRSERKIKLSTSGGIGFTEEKASTLPRYKPNRKHRHAIRTHNGSESSDDDFKGSRDRSTTSALDAISRTLPRTSNSRKVSAGDPKVQGPSFFEGAKLKSSTLEDSNELISQTARLLSATEENNKQDSSLKITQDVLHSLTQASDLLKSQLQTKERREFRPRNSLERSRDKEKKSMVKAKSHG